MSAVTDRNIPLTARQQTEGWDDGPAAVGRLVQRIEDLETELHHTRREQRQLRDELTMARDRERRLLRQLRILAALPCARARKRSRSIDHGQLPLFDSS